MAIPTLQELSPAAWAPAPAGFTPVKVAPPDRAGRIPGDFEPKIEESRRPFKLVRPGVLVAGYEVYRRLTAPLPPGLRLDAWRVNEALAAGVSAAVGLVAAEKHDVPREPGLLNRGFDRVPTLYAVRGGMTGLPTEGETPLCYCNHKTPIEGPELWAVVDELLAGEFAPADLDVFASSPKVGTVVLAACALEIVEAGQAAMSPRQLDALMRSLAGKLKGWSKTDTTSPFALALFIDAVTAAVSLAKPSELPQLVAKLLPRDPAATAGGDA